MAEKEVHDDVISDILSFLPVKSLLRFRCLSKNICALIDSPYFIKRHLMNYSIQTKSLVLRHYKFYSVGMHALDETPQQLHFPTSTYHCYLDIIGSANGLLCLGNGPRNVIIWNFATRKCHHLPLAVAQSQPPGTHASSTPFYGFGYDLVSDNYKILRLVACLVKSQGINYSFSKAQLYSSRSDTWQVIQDLPDHYYQMHGVLVCGALHWIVSPTRLLGPGNGIAAFDLASNKYMIVAKPVHIHEENLTHMSAEELGGCLCLTCNYLSDHIDIWVMKDYGVKESWSKLFSISQPKEISSFNNLIPLTYSKCGNEILLVQDNTNLIWYNLQERRVRIIDIRCNIQVSVCMESLVPLGEKVP